MPNNKSKKGEKEGKIIYFECKCGYTGEYKYLLEHIKNEIIGGNYKHKIINMKS